MNEYDSGKNISLLSRGSYYSINNEKKEYFIYADDSKNDFLHTEKQYPFYFTDFFAGLSRKNLQLERKNGVLHLFDLTNHYYFDTASYAIIGTKEFLLSSYGLQIKEWTVVAQEFYKACYDSAAENILDRLKTYKKRSAMEKVKNPWVRGTELINYLVDSVIVTANNGEIRKKDIGNKYILLDLFYQSCMPCIASFPHLKELQKKYGDTGKLIILGLDPVPEDSVSIVRFIKRYGLKYCIVTGEYALKIRMHLDPAGIFPYYLLIDANGKVIDVQEGFNEKFFKRVDKLLNRVP